MANNNVSKNKQGYGYKYTDIAQIHEWLEENNMTYYQYIERIEGDDYMITVPIVEGKELAPRRGCRVVNAELKGISNPAQEQGSAITYARRYSLLMAFGLATEDDDAQSLSRSKNGKITAKQKAEILAEINRTQVDINEVIGRYKISKIEDLQDRYYEGLISTLKGMATIG